MKNVLLLVHGDEGQAARLRAALDLTPRAGGASERQRCSDDADGDDYSGYYAGACEA